MMSKFKKLMAAALVLCLMLALLPVGVLAVGEADAGDASTPDAPVNENVDPQGGDNVGPNPGNDGTTTYTVTADPYMANGTVKFGKAGSNERLDALTGVAADTKVIVYPTADRGYEISSVSYKYGDHAKENILVDAASGNYVFDMPKGDVTVYATFSEIEVKPAYTVGCRILGTQGGEIHVDDNRAYHEGDTVYVYVTAYEGYSLDSLFYANKDWTVFDRITNNSFEMPSCNVTVYATFEETYNPPVTKYWVATSVIGDGGSIMQDNRLYAEGDYVTVSVTANDGYKLDQLFYIIEPFGSVRGVDIDQTTMKFKMPNSNVKVFATFEPIENYTFDINVETDNHCKAAYQSKAEPGEWVEVCIDDFDPGYHLYSVTFNGDLVTDDVYWYNGHWHYSFRMPWHDVKIYVATTDKLFVNTVYDINGGAVELWVKDEVSGNWDSTIYADAGEWVCVKATPKSGYELGDISVTGRWYGKSYDAYYNRYDGCYYFKMPNESVNLSVSFVDNSHKVIVKDVTNGSLKANTKWAVEDERVYITAVPDKGYELTWLYVKAADGSSVKVYEAIKEDTYYFFMPDQEVTVSAIFAYDYPDMPFIDVNPNSWYYSAIEFVYNKGIMNGVTASSFNPDGTITRGMIVTMLWRMAGEPSAVAAGFADVAADSYYAKAIAWAAKNGIIEGYSASSFGPNDAITREQLATVLYRYAKYLGYTTTGSSLSGYYDASRVSSWAKDAMGWAVKNGVVTGLSSTWLNPNGTASRAEAAQMFMNFYEFLG